MVEARGLLIRQAGFLTLDSATNRETLETLWHLCDSVLLPVGPDGQVDRPGLERRVVDYLPGLLDSWLAYFADCILEKNGHSWTALTSCWM